MVSLSRLVFRSVTVGRPADWRTRLDTITAARSSRAAFRKLSNVRESPSAHDLQGRTRASAAGRAARDGRPARSGCSCVPGERSGRPVRPEARGAAGEVAAAFEVGAGLDDMAGPERLQFYRPMCGAFAPIAELPKAGEMAGQVDEIGLLDMKSGDLRQPALLPVGQQADRRRHDLAADLPSSRSSSTNSLNWPQSSKGLRPPGFRQRYLARQALLVVDPVRYVVGEDRIQRTVVEAAEGFATPQFETEVSQRLWRGAGPAPSGRHRGRCRRPRRPARRVAPTLRSKFRGHGRYPEPLRQAPAPLPPSGRPRGHAAIRFFPRRAPLRPFDVPLSLSPRFALSESDPGSLCGGDVSSR